MQPLTRALRLLGALGACALFAVVSCDAVVERNPTDTVVETQSGSVAPTTASLSRGERTSTDDGEPVHGGTLVYGLEADTANPWAPYRASCSTSCRAVLKSISDPLFSHDPAGAPVPTLVESVRHNPDQTQWSLSIREGITFHDGTALDAEAVEFNIETCQHSPLTGSAYDAIDRVEASGDEVTITTRGGPWVALPAYFSDHLPCAFMFSPTWLGSLPDVPQRSEGSPVYDRSLAATPPDGDPMNPVGLGAFELRSYTPGNGNVTEVVRNDDYWRGPDGITGELLPYLDGIEFVVAVDEQSRTNALRSGEFDLIMTSNGSTISPFLDDDEFKVDTSTKFGDTDYIVLNTATGEADPELRNAQSPLLDLNCRQALASALDLDRYSLERTAGLAPAANGPFPPGSLGHLPDSGYPVFDVDVARAEMDECLSALGTNRIEFNFTTTNDPFNVETNEMIASMWREAFGSRIRVAVTQVEQGQFIGLFLTGSFQAQASRNHNGSDPDEQRIWWSSANAAPIGELALNFGRFKDPEIDTALMTIRTNRDRTVRRSAAEDINRRFGAQVWNLWLSWTLWGILQQPHVNGVQANRLPDGSEGIGLAYLGLHNINQMWCTSGTCD